MSLVNNRSALKIKVISSGGAIKPSTSAQAVTVTSASGVSSAALRLDALQDVVEQAPTNGSTLVYDVTTDKYIVKQLDLDGGTF